MKINIKNLEVSYQQHSVETFEINIYIFICEDARLEITKLITIEQIFLVDEILKDPNKAILNKNSADEVVSYFSKFKLKCCPDIKPETNIKELIYFSETRKCFEEAENNFRESFKRYRYID